MFEHINALLVGEEASMLGQIVQLTDVLQSTIDDNTNDTAHTPN